MPDQLFAPSIAEVEANALRSVAETIEASLPLLEALKTKTRGVKSLPTFSHESQSRRLQSLSQLRVDGWDAISFDLLPNLAREARRLRLVARALSLDVDPKTLEIKNPDA